MHLMKITPITSKKKLLYSVGILCASLTSCDEHSLRHQDGSRNIPGSEPNTPSSAQLEEPPILLGGDVPYIPTPEDEQKKQDTPPAN